MPQPKKGMSLGSDPAHQRLMLRNLARSLFEHERIKTTETKAKVLAPYAEKLITKAKKGTVHHRRLVLSEIEDRNVVHKLFADIAPRFSERNGGYTRVLKLGPRTGDGAAMALIELVEEGAATVPAAAAPTEETGRRRRLRRPGRRRGGGEAERPSDKPAVSKAAEASAAGGPIPGAATPAASEDAPEVEAGPELGVTDKAADTSDSGPEGAEGAGGPPGRRGR